MSRRIVHSALRAAIVVSVTVATPALACTCISTASTGAAQISGTVASGSAAIAAALQIGFDKTAVQFNASSADSADRITSALSGMTNALAEAMLAQPVLETAIEQNLRATSPAYHATNECEYLQRTNDSKAAATIISSQQGALADSVIAYNDITSNFDPTADVETSFKGQTNQLLNSNPGVKTAAMNLVGEPDVIGAMTPQEFQDASRALNLTLNPVPPQRIAKPSTPAQINASVDADLYNMRMQLPQGISQTILSYEAPILDLPEDSWFTTMLERMSPEDHAAFVAEDRNVSYSDMLKHMATHRMNDPSTVANTATKDPVGLQKDLAMVKADHLVMDYELWLQDRYQSLLLSQMVASQIRAERDQE